MKPDPRGAPDPWWVTGVVETEGSFFAERQGKHVVIGFSLAVRPENTAIVDALFAFFGVGRIYETRRGFLWKVVRPEELAELLEHFDRHPLRGSKREAYEIWREMVSLRSGTFRNAPLDALTALAERLAATRHTSTRTSTPDGPRVTRRKR